MTIHTMPCPTQFALKYPGWHTYAKDEETVNSVCAAIFRTCLKLT